VRSDPPPPSSHCRTYSVLTFVCAVLWQTAHRVQHADGAHLARHRSGLALGSAWIFRSVLHSGATNPAMIEQAGLASLMREPGARCVHGDVNENWMHSMPFGCSTPQFSRGRGPARDRPFRPQAIPSSRHVSCALSGTARGNQLCSSFVLRLVVFNPVVLACSFV
jgi:hypothetical protein